MAFDEENTLDKWLADGQVKRHKEQIVVYRDTSLHDKVIELRNEINLHNRMVEVHGEPEVAVGEESKSSQLQKRMEALEKEIEDSSATIEILALSDQDAEEIEAKFKKQFPKDTRPWEKTIKGLCIALAHMTEIDGEEVPLATFNGEALGENSWQRLANGPLAGGQWMRVKEVFISSALKTPRIDIPFSQSGLNLKRPPEQD